MLLPGKFDNLDPCYFVDDFNSLHLHIIHSSKLDVSLHHLPNLAAKQSPHQINGKR